MDDEKIEYVTFYKQIIYTTQIFDKNLGPSSVMAISLPRLKFLEKDGEYRPSWAIDKEPSKVEIPITAPAAQHRRFRKENYRRQMMHDGTYKITPLEQSVYDLYQQGLDVFAICEKLGKRPSAIGGAYGRFKAKTLAKQNKT
jgi:hypothetical protein